MQGSKSVGISANRRSSDLSDYGAELDMIEALGVDAIELPVFDLDLVVGARVLRPQLAALKAACAGRDVLYSVHGPLAINFMDEAWRLERHFEVLKASLEVSAEIGARHYVLHAGLSPLQQAAGLEAAYQRQREWLSRSGDLARDHGLVLCVETLFADYTGHTHTPSPSRLAQELRTIGHANVMATLDFSHSYIQLGFQGRQAAFLAEIEALAPLAQHLHIHDSFGLQDDIWMYTDGERVAYGHGDLHLPVGWGDIPWDDVVARCVFPQGVIFNIELNPRHWHLAQACVETTRRLANLARSEPATEVRDPAADNRPRRLETGAASTA